MEQKNISMDEIVGKMKTAFESMDKSRIKSLKEAQDIQNTKNEAWEREHQRLKQKYGANHPRVKKIEQRLSNYEPVSNAMEAETKRASIDIPPFEAGSWRIHGRVLDQDRNGVKGLTVFLSNENQQRVKDLGYDCTDERGYFSITYTRSPDDEEKQFPEVFLTVSDTDKNVIHREKEALSVVIGQIDYREIILGEDQCKEPPTDGDGDDNGNGGDGDNGDEADLTWTVKGTVLNASTGQGIRGLTVRLLDEYVLYENEKTDARGSFFFTFSNRNIPKLFEKTREVRLHVLDRSGNILHEEPLKVEAGKVEELTIKIRMEEEKERWVVKGTVTYPNSNRGHRGYTVDLFDKENEFTKRLRSTETKVRGVFELSYSPDEFPELFDNKPPLYISVRDKEGEVVYKSEKPMKVTLGHTEKINIEI